MNKFCKRCLSFLLVFSFFLEIFLVPEKYCASEYEEIPSFYVDEYYLDFFILYRDSWKLIDTVECFGGNEVSGNFYESYLDHAYPNAKFVSYFYLSSTFKEGSVLSLESYFDIDAQDAGNICTSPFSYADLYGLNSAGEWFYIASTNYGNIYNGSCFSFYDFYLFRDCDAFRVDFYCEFKSVFESSPFGHGSCTYNLYGSDDFILYGDGPRISSSSSNINEELQEDQLELTNNIFENVKNIVSYILKLPSNIASNLFSFFSSLEDSVSTLQYNVKVYLNNLGTFIVNGLDSALDAALSVLPDDIEAAFRSTLDGIRDDLFDVVDSVSTLQYNVKVYLNNLGTFIVDGLKSALDAALSVLPDDIEAVFRSSLKSIRDGLSEVVNSVSNFASDYKTIIGDLDDSLSGGFDDLGSYFLNLPGRISEALWSSFDGVIAGFKDVGNGILSGLADLFIPDQSYFETAFATIGDKLPFVEVIVVFFQNLLETLFSLNMNECPDPFVIDVLYSGQTLSITVMDLSWYTPYKPYGDIIISGFIIFSFVTNIFFNLNNIIRGTNSDIKTVTDIAKGE